MTTINYYFPHFCWLICLCNTMKTQFEFSFLHTFNVLSSGANCFKIILQQCFKRCNIFIFRMQTSQLLWRVQLLQDMHLSLVECVVTLVKESKHRWIYRHQSHLYEILYIQYRQHRDIFTWASIIPTCHGMNLKKLYIIYFMNMHIINRFL
jgi:hypothetical protein